MEVILEINLMKSLVMSKFEHIQILSPTMQHNTKFAKVSIGERTLSFMESNTKLKDEGKVIVIDEARRILEHCIVPGHKDNITNIAVGYIQSGKTMSYTTLTTLAADSGYRIIIYLTGVTTSLGNQTYNRIKRDLDVARSQWFAIFEGKTEIDTSVLKKVRNYLHYSPDTTLLFPILKHYKHIQNLAELFGDPTIKSLINDKGVLIIDDEADQASFNTYARRNSNKKEWEVDEFSKTYASIVELRKIFPSLSYVQYTATPQAAFLIDNNDILSPQYHQVLSPGEGYTGGKFFFENDTYKLIGEIPVYDSKNPALECPPSLEKALMEFLVSVAIVVYIEKRNKVDFLSMMIHPDGTRLSNEKFYTWTASKVSDSWLQIICSQDGDPAKELLFSKFEEAYKEISKYDENRPSFAEVKKYLGKVLLNTELHLVQDKTVSILVEPEKEIDWDEATAHILIGANILNRGFTVENLSMTYMPRTSKGKSNADTIEQRCRFFGYKMAYFDVCRVYVSAKSIAEYKAYVKHEEILRTNLKACESLSEFSKRIVSMNLSSLINATRTNILSKKLIKGKMSGWKTMATTDYIDENKAFISEVLKSLKDKFIVSNPEMENLQRRHRYVKLAIDDFIKILKAIKFADLPCITRKIVTIQYLNYLKDNLNLQYAYLFEMAYDLPEKDWRKYTYRDGKPANIMPGYSPSKKLPAYSDFKFDDSLCLQVHHLVIGDGAGWLNGKDLYNFTIYYPEALEQSFVAMEQDDEEEEED